MSTYNSPFKEIILYKFTCSYKINKIFKYNIIENFFFLDPELFTFYVQKTLAFYCSCMHLSYFCFEINKDEVQKKHQKQPVIFPIVFYII